MDYRIWTMKHYGKAEKRSQVIHYMHLRRLLNCPNKLGTIIELYSSSGTSTSSQKKEFSKFEPRSNPLNRNKTTSYRIFRWNFIRYFMCALMVRIFWYTL